MPYTGQPPLNNHYHAWLARCRVEAETLSRRTCRWVGEQPRAGQQRAAKPWLRRGDALEEPCSGWWTVIVESVVQAIVARRGGRPCGPLQPRVGPSEAMRRAGATTP